MLLYQKEPWWTLVNPVAILQRLHRHRSLLWQFVWRNIELQHKGSLLGLAWSVCGPLLLFAVYAFVFVVVLDNRFGVVATESRADYAIGLFLGLALLQSFLETMTMAPLAIVLNRNYVKKVVFPLEILPVAVFGAALFRCLVALGLALAATMIWGPGLAATAWWLVAVIGLLSLLSLGVAWILSSVGVFLRDLAPMMQFCAVLVMFMSGVFYSVEKIPGAFAFLRFNPLLVLVDTTRDIVLWHLPPSLGELAYVGVIGVLCCLLGHLIFSTAKPAFANVL